MTLEWIRFGIAAALIACGLCFALMATYGVYRFKYVLNRMHTAAMGDTLGISLTVLGLCVLSGWSLDTLKLILIVILFWMTSPASSHLIMRLVVTTDEHLDEHLTRRSQTRADDGEAKRDGNI